MILGKDSHPRLQILDKVSQLSPQCLGKDANTTQARNYTQVPSVLRKNSHSSPKAGGQGHLTPQVLDKDSHPSLEVIGKASPQARMVLGEVSNPSIQVLGKDLPWAGMVLDKDLHPSLQVPRQELTPHSPQGPRQGLTLELAGS